MTNKTLSTTSGSSNVLVSTIPTRSYVPRSDLNPLAKTKLGDFLLPVGLLPPVASTFAYILSHEITTESRFTFLIKPSGAESIPSTRTLICAVRGVNTLDERVVMASPFKGTGVTASSTIES